MSRVYGQHACVPIMDPLVFSGPWLGAFVHKHTWDVRGRRTLLQDIWDLANEKNQE